MTKAKRILNLMKLDFYMIRRKTIIPLTAVFFLFAIISILVFPHLLPVMTTFFGIGVIPIIAMTEQPTGRVFHSVPCKRHECIFAHFTLGLAINFVACFLSMFVGILSEKLDIFRELFQKHQDSSFEPLYDMLIDVNITIPVTAVFVFALNCFMVSYCLMLNIIFGSDKEVATQTISLLVLIGILFIIVKTKAINIDKLAIFLTPILMNHKTAFMIVCALIGIAFTFIFALISTKVYSKREV